MIILMFFLFAGFELLAVENSQEFESPAQILSKEKLSKKLTQSLLVDPEITRACQNLVVLHNGRYKPMLALANEFAWALSSSKKIHVSSEVNNETTIKKFHPLNVILDMKFRPELWSQAPLLPLNHPQLKQICELDPNSLQNKISLSKFLSLMHSNSQFNELVSKNFQEMNAPNSQGPKTKLDDKVRDLIFSANWCQSLIDDQLLMVVPNPQDEKGAWLSVSQTQELEGFSKEKLEKLRLIWNELRQSWLGADQASFLNQLNLFAGEFQPRTQMDSIVPGGYGRIQAEIKYLTAQPFMKGTYLALLALVFILPGLGSKGNWRTWLMRVGALTLLSSASLMAWGFWMRATIADRGPIHSIYETVVYATMGIMFLALILEFWSRKGLSLLVGAILGCLGGICAAKLGSRMDPNFQRVMPVLRSGWLIVHVQVIILGYAAALLSAGLGHAILIGRLWLKKTDTTMKTLENLCYRSVQFAVLFLTFGILLGAWWANESWGRYWGWDPKETWALISLLIFLALVHFRQAGYVRQLGTASLSILGGMMVIFCWWGVNYVLGVGLHAYATGFSDVMPTPAVIYYGIELVFLALALSKYLESRSTLGVQ